MTDDGHDKDGVVHDGGGGRGRNQDEHEAFHDATEHSNSSTLHEEDHVLTDNEQDDDDGHEDDWSITHENL